MVRATLRAHPVVVARVTFAELAASVARAARMAAITDAQRDAILGRLTHDFSRLQVIELRASMLTVIPELVVHHPLRGYDAIQLATALHVQAS
jgi:predicted nucleic acid-binding protein